jgi:hypothetical protein
LFAGIILLVNEREQAIRAMRRLKSAQSRIKAKIKEAALAGARRAAERALNETRLTLTSAEFDEAVHGAIEELCKEIGRESDARNQRIVNALAELIPLLDHVRTVARGSASSEREQMLEPLTRSLDRWRRRYDATATARQIVTWLLDGDRPADQPGPKKRAEGIGYKVTALLPWIGSITPQHVKRIYSKNGRPRFDGWWLKVPPKLSEPARAVAQPSRPLSVPGARRKSRSR